MTRVALKGLAGRKLRATLTALAIVLGVAMISGTYVLTDTMKSAFDTLFQTSYAGTDAVVSGEGAFDTDFGQPPPFSQDLLAEVRALPEVEAAVGAINDEAQLTQRDGEAIETQGAPALAFGTDPRRERFNAVDIVSGSWPSGPDEVVIDAGTADEEGYAAGDDIGVVARGPTQPFTISGIGKFGDVDSIGSATFAIFDIPTAQRLFDKEGELDGIQAAAAPGVSQEQLLAEIEPLLPGGTKVQTGAAQALDDGADTEELTDFIRYFLLAFAGVALLVGAFVIFNTISITVAQRTREFATLRTLGASRRNVLWAVILEALVVGALASVVGLFAGLGLAEGLNQVFVSFGIELPSAGTVFATRTIVVSLVVGVLVTVLAGLFPAIRATRVPPIAAVREGATLPRSRVSRAAPALAAVTTALAVALIVYGSFAGGLGVQERLFSMIGGVVILFVGVALLSSRLVRPLASVLGWPARRTGGVAGRLADRNAARNPSRTASTASALMIGLALITFVAVLAAGLRSSVGDAIEAQVSADYVVASDDGFTPFRPAAGEAAEALPGVRTVAIRGDVAQAFGAEHDVTGVDPEAIASVYRFDWTDGSDAALDRMGTNGTLVEKSFADEHDLRPGSAVELLAPDGTRRGVTVRGVFESPPFWQMLGAIVVPIETFDATFQDPRNLYSFVDVDGGASAGATGELQAALAGFPSVGLDTRDGFVDQQQASIDPLLNLLYVLLALSVVVSLFGIVNTLVLAVLERTRELGMLRAVGMTRRQVRRMVRHESVITALIGGALGMVLGLFLAGLVTQALSDEGVVFSVPVASLVVFLGLAVLAGVVAAILPARRAARLNPLEALKYE